MAKERVVNVRVSESQRAAYERAATLAGTSVSGLITSAADVKADEILHDASSMTLPAAVFDRLLAALDETMPLAPSLDKAFSDRQFENR